MVPIEAIMSILGNALLFVLVFSMSATVDVNCILVQIQNYKAIAVGVLGQFVLLPLLGFVTVKYVVPTLSYPVGLMILIVTSSPGGSYSNWWCSLFNADLALSVTMTAISTIFSIIMLPFNLVLYTKFTYDADVLQSLDWISIFISLSIVISAIVFGLYCSYTINNHTFNKISNHCGNASGLLLILFSATLANFGGGSSSVNDDGSTNESSRIWNRDISFYVAIIFPCFTGICISLILSSYCKLLKPERITVAIETCYQNVGIATSLALTMFDTPQQVSEAMGVPFLYGIVEAIFVGLLCVVAWKCDWTKAPSNTPFWKVITTSYEVLQSELKDVDGIEVTAVNYHYHQTNNSNTSDKNQNNSSKKTNDDIPLESNCCSSTVVREETQEGSIFTTYFFLNSLTTELFDPKPYNHNNNTLTNDGNDYQPPPLQQPQQLQSESSSLPTAASATITTTEYRGISSLTNSSVAPSQFV